MEAEHSETIVDKAVAYVKDMLGMPPADRPPDVVANPEHTDTAPELTSEDAMRLDPHAYLSTKSWNAHDARRRLQERSSTPIAKLTRTCRLPRKSIEPETRRKKPSTRYRTFLAA